MSRDSSGTYTLPAGNPVVDGTTIDATVHNNTLDDIADELSDSLSRSGKGGMTAAFKLADGTVSLPAISFTTDTNTGIYRVGADEIGFAVGGDVALAVYAEGIKVYSITGATPIVGLYDDAETILGQVNYSSGLYLYNRVASSVVVLMGTDAGSASSPILSGSPVGGVTMYYDGTQAFKVTDIGIQLFAFTNDNPTIELYQNDLATRNGYLQFATTALNIVNEVHGTPINIIGENNAGVAKYILVGDPDSTTDLFYAGSRILRTNDVGMLLYSSTNDNPELHFYQDDLTTRNAAIQAHSTSGLILSNEVNGAPITLYSDDAGGTQRVLINADPDTGITMYYGAVSALATAPIASNGTGATVTDGGGVARPVGFNILPITSISSATDLRIANSGHELYATASLAVDIDTTTDSAPNGSVWIVANESGGAITITATGVTLRWFDGSTGGTGTRTIANYGKVSITKRANGFYQIEGSGVT